MRSPVDALRSLNRYVAVTLGADWEVRMAGEKGVFHRPYARVQQVPSIQMVTQAWHTSKLIASFTVVAYPLPGAASDESMLAAQDVADLFWTAFAGPGVGNATVRKPVDSHRARPYRIPLYDYAGVPITGPSAGVDETRRDPRDFLHMEGPPEVATYQDPDDELLYSVAANIRMSWLRSAAVTSGQPVTVSVGASGEANG